MESLYENNKWKNDEDDEDDINEDYVQNEVPPEPINEEFVNNIVKIKNNLYDNIVLGPEEGTPEAQSRKLLQDYLNKVNEVYILSLNAQKGIILDNEQYLNKFPVSMRESIKLMLHWIANYFKKNRVSDTIPYTDYIYKSFKEYPFVQKDSFE
jgi:hypothetical protein